MTVAMGRLSDQDQLDWILTQSSIETEDPPAVEPVPTPLSPIPEVVDRPNPEPLNQHIDDSASAVRKDVVDIPDAGQEDVVEIVNGTLSTKQHQPKRKAENTVDHEIPDSKPGKKRKVDRSVPVTYMTTDSRAVEGKLARPPPQLIAREDIGFKSKKPWDVPDHSPEPIHSRFGAEGPNPRRMKKPPIKSSADSTPHINTNSELAASSPKKEPKKAGRPRKNSSRQAKPVNEGSGRTLRSQKADGGTSISAHNPEHNFPRSKTRGVKPVAVDVNSEISDGEADGRPDVQKEASDNRSDNDPSLGNEDLPANGIIDAGKPGPAPQQRPKRNPPPPKTRKAKLPAFSTSPETSEEEAGEQPNVEGEASDNDLPSGNQEVPAPDVIDSRKPRPVSQQSPQCKLPPRKTRRAEAPASSANPELEDDEADEQPIVDQGATDGDASPRNQDLPANKAIAGEDTRSLPPLASGNTYRDDAEEPPSKNRPKHDYFGAATGDSANLNSRDSPSGSNHENDEISQTAQNPEPDLQQSDIVLFGQEEAWQKILNAKRKIDVSKIRGDKSGKIADLTKGKIKSLVKRSEDAVRSYESLASEATASVEMMDQHQRNLRGIRKEITNLPLENLHHGDEGSKLIQDIYAHAVPSMVTLLKKALETRGPVIARGNDVTVLKEIISIQDALLTLCERARGSKAKPKTERPIIQPTVTIKRYVEAVRAAFNAELDKRKRHIKKRENEARRMREEEEEERARQEQTEVRRREKDARDRREWEEVSRKCAGLPGFLKFSSQSRSKKGPEYRRLEVPVVNQWSREQDSELLMELLAEEHGELPAEERYLRALNAPSLKNKLPMHIQERALGYKEAMEKVFKDQGRQIPHWLLNIE